MNKKTIIALISSLVILSDFITKKIIVSKVMFYEHIDVLPFLRIVHIENKGAAFGMFSNLGNHIFIIISLIAIFFIIMYLLKIPKGLELYSLSLILGGAIGNLLDRLKTGKVIDFIDVYVNHWHWPAFNVADSALTVGIIMFIWSNFISIRSKDAQ
ncbi:MAG: signal peptidase II [Nitrospirota bacterium]|nr:signal peptidase II [Nitrospirota bacterium]